MDPTKVRRAGVDVLADDSPWSARSPVANLLCLAMVFGVYVLGGTVGLSLAFGPTSVSAVWPSAGIALAALLTLGYRVWPAIFAGAFVVNVTAGATIPTSLGIAAGNALAGLLGAYLLARFANGARAFDRARDVFTFVGLGAVLSTMVSATTGVTSLTLQGDATWADFGPIWLARWLGDAVGALIFTPLVVLWLRPSRPDVLWHRPLEVASLLVSTILIGLLVFGEGLVRAGVRPFPLTFLCTASLMWAAFRFQPREAVTLMAVLSGIAIWKTLGGSGPFASASVNESLLLLQAFMGTVSVMILPAAALVEERRRVEADREDLLARAKAARAEAEGAGRAKDEFLAMFGHEVRNPLATMISAVSVLDRSGVPDDIAAGARGAIRHQITNLSRLVDELVDVACVTRGEIVLACEPVNLATSVLRSVRALQGSTHLQRHVVDVQAEPAWVNADPTRLDQIVANLLKNATRYTPPGGTIRVRVTGEADEAVVRVADTGIGIPPELLPRIFDRAVPAGPGLGRGGDGLGVGLRLVRRLVNLHGGQVRASSDGPGRGSEFVVRLPRIAPALAETESEELARLIASLSFAEYTVPALVTELPGSTQALLREPRPVPPHSGPGRPGGRNGGPDNGHGPSAGRTGSPKAGSTVTTAAVEPEWEIAKLRAANARLRAQLEILGRQVHKSEQRRRALLHILQNLSEFHKRLTNQRNEMRRRLIDSENNRRRLAFAPRTEWLDRSRTQPGPATVSGRL
jgi:signal transduction histidine kinase